MTGNIITPSAGEKEILDETAKRICAHMNEDHAVTVYAMAKRKVELPRKGWKISDAFLKNITMEGCYLQVIMCHDVLCQDVKLIFPFEPPLADPAKVRSRIIAIHHEVCQPFSVYASPFFSAIVVLFAGSAWCTFGIQTGELEPYFANAARVCFYVTLLGHSLLAFYGAYLCRRVLKLSTRGTVTWYGTILLSGVLAIQELRELVEVDRKCKAAKKEKAS